MLELGGDNAGIRGRGLMLGFGGGGVMLELGGM